MYKITLLDNSVVLFNEKIIMKIYSNDNNTFTLEHFNHSKIVIKSFSKV